MPSLPEWPSKTPLSTQTTAVGHIVRGALGLLCRLPVVNDAAVNIRVLPNQRLGFSHVGAQRF